MDDLNTRKSTHLNCIDYTSGCFFLTITAHRRTSFFGELQDGVIQESASGLIVRSTWLSLFQRYPSLRQGPFVIMPDHFHAIVTLTRTREGQSPSPTLHQIICAFKSLSTKRCNAQEGTPGQSLWQRGYYEHAIRNQLDYDEISAYIVNNPMRRWLRRTSVAP